MDGRSGWAGRGNREGGAAVTAMKASARVFLRRCPPREARWDKPQTRKSARRPRSGGRGEARARWIDRWRDGVAFMRERLTNVCVCARACVGSGVGDAKRRKRADGVGRREDGRGD